jgi:hypothetical protein
MVTDAAWRENRIHPEDRDRLEASLQRAPRFIRSRSPASGPAAGARPCG